MNEDLRQPVEQPLVAPSDHDHVALRTIGADLPAGAFTASVLFDVLSLVAENQQQAYTYMDGATNLLKMGLGAALAALGIELVDSLKTSPASVAGRAATKRLALDGAVVAVYLLDLAARQKQLAAAHTREAPLQSAPLGFSLAGLALLAAAGKVQFLRKR